MGTQGLDVILGMNWLHKNQATVSCDKRTVKLVSPSGKEVVTKLYLPKLEGACHHLSVDDKESNTIETIRIVSKSLMYSLKSYQACHLTEKLNFP
jgi:carboxylesterase type B